MSCVSIRGLLLLAIGSIAASSCYIVADVDRFHDSGAGGAGGQGFGGRGGSEPDDTSLPSSLDLTFRGMGPHLNEMLEFRIVDSTHFVQFRGVLDPLDEPSVDEVVFHVKNAIPAGTDPFMLDFYGDVNGSGEYDGLPMEGDVLRDHAWRIDPLADFPSGEFPHSANLVRVIYQHNVDFTDIGYPDSYGADVVLHFDAASVADYQGALLEAKVVQAHPPFQTVGLYRNPSIPSGDLVARIGGMVELGDEYNIDIYIDANSDSEYQNPETGPDKGWRFLRTAVLQGGAGGAGGGGEGGGAASPVGIDLAFDPTEPSNVDVGEP